MKAVKDNSVPSGYDIDEHKFSFSKSYAKFKKLDTNIVSRPIQSEEFDLVGYDSDEQKHGFSKSHSEFFKYNKSISNPKTKNESIKNFNGLDNKSYSSVENFEDSIPNGFDKDENKYGFSISHAKHVKPEEKNTKPVKDPSEEIYNIKGTDKDEQKHGFSRIFANVKNALGFK